MQPIDPALSPDFVATLPHWLQVTLVILGIVTTTASAFAAAVNAIVRTMKARGLVIPTWLLLIAAVVNVPAINPDKTVEALKTASKQAEPVPVEVPPEVKP